MENYILETILVIGIVTGAMVGIGYRYWKNSRRNKVGGCSGCANCPTSRGRSEAVKGGRGTADKDTG